MKHGSESPELFEMETVFRGFADDMKLHMEKEGVLFPAIRRRDEGLGGAPMIGAMLAEHVAAGRELAEMRRLSGNYGVPEGVCAIHRGTMAGLAELDADMQNHVEAEDQVLFPRSLALT